jgi:hypothetical protein
MDSTRKYPLKKPEGHQPPVPRWRLVGGPEVTHVHVIYVGVQQHVDSEASTQARNEALQAILTWSGNGRDEEAPNIEVFDLIDGNDAQPARIWACYWSNEDNYKSSLERLALANIHSNLPANGRSDIGLWYEAFSLPISRLETNYSGLDYLPGFARLPGTTTEAHTLTAYWGAARDRIPDSSHDLFIASPAKSPAEVVSTGGVLKGTNNDNVVHIRTGQFWQNCNEEESYAYEHKLEPTLEAGLHYLWENPSTTGAMGLRYLRNTGLGEEGNRKETCVTGFFTSLDKLENWAKSYKSHLAIYNGAMRHAKLFGPDRKFRTWHEVVVLKKGEAKLEYVNCIGNTGLISYLEMEKEDLRY